jgi:hypothetical protein
VTKVFTTRGRLAVVVVCPLCAALVAAGGEDQHAAVHRDQLDERQPMTGDEIAATLLEAAFTIAEGEEIGGRLRAGHSRRRQLDGVDR